MLLTRRRRRKRTPLPDGLSNALDVGDRIVTRTLPGTPDQLAVARRVVGDMLRRHGDSLRHDAGLAATELVANAVRHTRSGEPGGTLVLTAVLSRASVRIDVRDQGSETTPHIAHHHPHTEPVGGRGLAIVDRLARRWGFVREPGRRCTVWFEIALDSA